MHKTQFGFREGMSSSYAIHIIRRTLDMAERSGHKVFAVFLDWEKAFDKILHSRIKYSMDKFQIPAALQAAIMQLYSIPTFTVSFNDQTSNKYEQAKGIRQGCTLSPYLFLIAMTALMKPSDRNETFN